MVPASAKLPMWVAAGREDVAHVGRVVSRLPAYEHSTKWRLLSVASIVLLVLMVPVSVLWYGLPVLWRDYPAELRRSCLTLWRGKPGPYKGVVW